MQRWDIATGAPIGEPIAGGGGAKFAAFSPDSKMIVAAFKDNRLRLWDTETGQPIGLPLNYEGLSLSSVAFGPDGQTIISEGDHSEVKSNDFGRNYTARLWHVPTPVDDDFTSIKVWVEGMTGLELAADGTVEALNSGNWQARRARLEQRGGMATNDSAWLSDPILTSAFPTARARALIDRRKWSEAEASYAEAVQVRPFNRAVRLESSRFYVQRMRPEKAAANFREAVRLDPADYQARHLEILSLVAAGDCDGFGRACLTLLDEFRKPAHQPSSKWNFDLGEKWTEYAATANGIAWSLTLAPCAVADKSVPLRFAEIAVKRLSGSMRHNALCTLGAALYRAGRFEDAIVRLEEGAGPRKEDSLPQARLFLAMAHHHLGHRDEARLWLDRLRDRQPSNDPERFWDELEIRVLRSEAEALILYDPAFPADPFAR
jgi:tetratricopeptide (TPR) repeat protein